MLKIKFNKKRKLILINKIIKSTTNQLNILIFKLDLKINYKLKKKKLKLNFF